MVHDNTIESYSVDYENELLVIKTRYNYTDTPEKTNVVFHGYLFHIFYSEMNGSTIFDIVESPLSVFFEKEHESLNRLKKHDSFIMSKSAHDLKCYLGENNLKAFYISSVHGLYGWVIAKEMEIKVKIS